MGGKTYDTIADELGVSKQRAYQLVTEGLTEIKTETHVEAARLKEVELARLDRLQVAIWEAVIKGDVQAIDRYLKIMKRRAELLGLDAPVKADVTSGGEKIKAYVTISPADWDKDADDSGI
jgi:hypothetical protein